MRKPIALSVVLIVAAVALAPAGGASSASDVLDATNGSGYRCWIQRQTADALSGVAACEGSVSFTPGAALASAVASGRPGNSVLVCYIVDAGGKACNQDVSWPSQFPGIGATAISIGRAGICIATSATFDCGGPSVSIHRAAAGVSSISITGFTACTFHTSGALCDRLAYGLPQWTLPGAKEVVSFDDYDVPVYVLMANGDLWAYNYFNADPATCVAMHWCWKVMSDVDHIDSETDSYPWTVCGLKDVSLTCIRHQLNGAPLAPDAPYDFPSYTGDARKLIASPGGWGIESDCIVTSALSLVCR